ncbi:two-component sensor histidine kinase [Chryseotalea sanaruensis]|uniref:histidine kinase n=1 Tax=Chryseotalea sanaruensis TaxID=2482724 RepID=A0A401U5U6_9BACT|nr:tetratricopeptide repeat-containing sensor histidine kinase [Chryseotalea sanaruensis]GCC50255.1 two-component sensor histidine kinase [Chryseotalea sanaruensis]
MLFRFFSVFVLLLITLTGVLAQEKQDLTWYLGFLDYSKKDPALLIEESSKRLQTAIEIQDLASQASEYKEQGLLALTRTHNYAQAYDFFTKALDIEDSLSLNYERTITYLAIAQLYHQVKEPIKSLQTLNRGIAFQEKTDDLNLRVYYYTQLGKQYLANNNTALAIEQYEVVLELLADINKPSLKGEAYYNIANAISIDGDFEKALKYYKMALNEYRSVKEKKREAIALNDIAKLYKNNKNYERALANYNAALEIRQSLKDKPGIAQTYNDVAILYFDKQNIQQAIPNLELALAEAKEINATGETRRSYEYLYLCYKNLNDFQRALYYLEQFTSYNEMLQQENDQSSILSKEAAREIAIQESKVEKLEIERLQREKELQTQKEFRRLLMIGMALVAIIASLIFILYISKRRANRLLAASNERIQQQNLQLQDLNATKDKFFSIISHDLKGPLNSLTSFSGLLINHTDKLSKEDIQMLATDLDKSVKNLFALLENLLEWSRSQTGNIEFKPEAIDLTEILNENKSLLEAQANAKNINIEQLVHQPMPLKAHRHSVTTVVRNLLSNAIKFTPEGGTISLNMEKENRFVKVSVRDTGVGMSPEVMDKLFRIDSKHSTKGTANEKGTGLGLILCKDFIEKNGGQIGVSSELNKGSVFYFTLPLA